MFPGNGTITKPINPKKRSQNGSAVLVNPSTGGYLLILCNPFVFVLLLTTCCDKRGEGVQFLHYYLCNAYELNTSSTQTFLFQWYCGAQDLEQWLLQHGDSQSRALPTPVRRESPQAAQAEETSAAPEDSDVELVILEKPVRDSPTLWLQDAQTPPWNKRLRVLTGSNGSRCWFRYIPKRTIGASCYPYWNGGGTAHTFSSRNSSGNTRSTCYPCCRPLATKTGSPSIGRWSVWRCSRYWWCQCSLLCCRGTPFVTKCNPSTGQTNFHQKDWW